MTQSTKYYEPLPQKERSKTNKHHSSSGGYDPTPKGYRPYAAVGVTGDAPKRAATAYYSPGGANTFAYAPYRSGSNNPAPVTPTDSAGNASRNKRSKWMLVQPVIQTFKKAARLFSHIWHKLQGH